MAPWYDFVRTSSFFDRHIMLTTIRTTRSIHTELAYQHLLVYAYDEAENCQRRVSKPEQTFEQYHDGCSYAESAEMQQYVG